MEVEVRKRMRIDLDRLPIKRLHAIDELGNEQFPPEKSKEEERLAAIRRIDFSSVVEKEKRKKEKESEEEEAQKSKENSVPMWQGLIENLQQAQRELTVILDLISIVEANDAVAVAGMQRPKQLPTESLSDFAVSAATKLQRLRSLGRYFKQSSKTMEQQVVKEARFYGSLIRLQQNWKVKRQRVAAPGSGIEGFTFELYDTSIPSSLSTIRIDQDKSGMLSIQLPQKACRSLALRFLGDDYSACGPSPAGKKLYGEKEGLSEEDLDSCVETTHSVLRNIHRALFEERVFELVNRETFSQSKVINVTGMREDLLQLVIGQDSSLCISLVEEREKEKEREKDGSQTVDSYNEDSESSSSSALIPFDDKNGSSGNRDSKSGNPKPVSSLEIYLLSIFHKESVAKSNSGSLLGHFCMTVAHRLFSNKVLSVLESLVSRVQYLELISNPTWQSRSSSWSLCVKVPEKEGSDASQQKGRSKMETKVVVMDGHISLKGESCATMMASFNSAVVGPTATESYSFNSCSCDLDDLPMLLLQQVASQVIHWLHEEALVLGLNSIVDFLSLNLDLDQSEMLTLGAQVDPDDPTACISWWLLIQDPKANIDDPHFVDKMEGENRRFLGPLSLRSLYAVLMDLVSLSRSGNC